jgi:hypothetical protein
MTRQGSDSRLESVLNPANASTPYMLAMINEGYGDPQLPFEMFNDFTLSHETRDRLQCQVEVEDMLMLDNDRLPELYGHQGGKRKR